MLALVKPFIDICLLRLGPQHLPASGMLLAIALVAHTVTTIALSTMTLDAGEALLAGCLSTLLLCLLVGSALYVQRMNARMVQTLTALAGSGSVIAVLALPVAGWLQSASAPDGGSADLARIALLALMGWSIAVAGHVLRHALSVPFVVGIVLAVVFSWISVVVVDALIPMGA